MDLLNIRKWVLKAFKLHGYSVQADAAAYLAQQLAPLELDTRRKWMEKVTLKIQELKLEVVAVKKEHIELCLEECTKKQPSTETIFSVINCLEVPCFTYHIEKCKFVRETNGDGTLFPPASAKSKIYRKRYSVLLQRTRRHELFRKQILGETGRDNYELRTAEWFLSCSERVLNAVMLGMLVQTADGHYNVEDPTGSVRLDLSENKFCAGLFTDQSFVLAEGIYDDNVFYAKGIGHPPAEPAQQTRPYFGNLNYFGGPSESSLSQSISLLKIQTDNPDAVILFLSEVWLDDHKVLEKLKTICDAYANFPPVALVLMGNFLSMQPGPPYASRLKAAFKALGDMIAGYPNICQKSHIVLVPGPSDPGSPLILPRFPLPNILAEDLTRKIPNLVLASNPCRIQYCTRQIVVIREDLMTKICRNVIHFPENLDKIHEQLAKTLACQATLVPLPLHVCPVYWKFSQGLELYPLPDVVIMGDQCKAFRTNYMDCHVVNAGYFRKNGFSFEAYSPESNKIEVSQIPDEDS